MRRTLRVPNAAYIIAILAVMLASLLAACGPGGGTAIATSTPRPPEIHEFPVPTDGSGLFDITAGPDGNL
jgi:hypothetical protein